MEVAGKPALCELCMTAQWPSYNNVTFVTVDWLTRADLSRTPVCSEGYLAAGAGLSGPNCKGNALRVMSGGKSVKVE